eukprot:4758879-Heterocapsa_arctica.AAC.1
MRSLCACLSALAAAVGRGGLPGCSLAAAGTCAPWPGGCPGGGAGWDKASPVGGSPSLGLPGHAPLGTPSG